MILICSVRGSPNGIIHNFTNGAIGSQLLPFGEPVVSSALPLIGTNGITNGTVGRSTLVEP